MSLKLFNISFYLYIFVCVSVCIKIWMQRNQKDHEQEKKKKKVSLTKYNQSDLARPFNDKSVNQKWSTADFWEEG